MNMTPRENFHRMMRGKGAKWLPLDLPCTPPILDLIEKETGKRDPVEAFNLDMRWTGVGASGDPAAWRSALEKLGYEAPAGAKFDGMGWATVEPDRASVGAAYHFVQELHPLAVITSVEQLKTLPWPDVHEARHYAGMEARVRAIHDTGRFAVAGLGCTLFETSWYRRGMDNLYMDLAEGNGISDWLMDWFTERSCVAGRAAVGAGADVIGLGDDIGTQRGMMMSPDYWREHLKWRLKRVVDAIRQAAKEMGRTVYILYHSDGDIRDVLDELFEMGIDILNPLQPECMPVREVVEKYHGQGFWGGIGIQTTMPFGNPEDVRAVVAELVDLARGGARIVIAPTHVLEPEVPWGNIKALVEAARGM